MRLFVPRQSHFHPFCWLMLGFALTASTAGVTLAADSKDAKKQKALELFRSIVWQEGRGPANWARSAKSRSRRVIALRARRARGSGPNSMKTSQQRRHGGPHADGFQWLVHRLTYEDSGHIADDEKGKLDAAAILATLRESNDAGNEERRRRGWAPLELVGWQAQPLTRRRPTSHLGLRAVARPGEHQLQHADPGPDRRHVGQSHRRSRQTR